MKTITVKASKPYTINIGAGILGEAGSIIKQIVGGLTAAIITDDNVSKLYAKQLVTSLARSGYHVVQYVFPNGESSKNIETFISIINFLAEEKLSRTDLVAALGGGVVGDLAGFAAACYMRGIHFVQIPTTLLAAVDSSVGGKTAVNLAAGKNMAGAFYQPDAVICDVSLLSTLQAEIFQDGCAEIIKHSIIADRALFESLKTPIQGRLEDVIARNVEIKRDVVVKDEFESNTRKLLNLGHTAGHAIELLSGYQVSHGHAIAAGMAIVTRAAVRMEICDSQSLHDILQMLQLHKLPLNTNYKADELTNACLMDKKRDSEYLTMVFPVKIGECVLKRIQVSELRTVIQLGLEEM